MKRYVCYGVVVLMVAVFGSITQSNAAQPSTNKGLVVSPIREYTDAKAGKTHTNAVTIANITDKPITVTLSFEQFSVADYSYDYQFKTPTEDWIKFKTTQIELQPFKSKTVDYVINVPKLATPGGHYFTIFANTILKNNSIESTVRAASVLYVTVEGKLHRTSEVRKETISQLSFGSNIDFKLDVLNTGNTHFFVYTSGKLNGLSAKPEGNQPAQILLPGSIRTLKNTIQAPLLPGVYKASYGYKTENGPPVIRSKNIIYAPLWSLVALTVIVVVTARLLILGHRRIRYRD